MTFRFSTAIVALAAAFAALPASADVPTTDAQAQASEQQSARDKLAFDATKPLGTAAPEGYQPPFTQETVIKLNAIMQRTIDTLDEFDRLTGQIATARNGSDSARIAEINTRLGNLQQQATAAHTDFQAEKAALIARQEFYDKSVLAAMEYFVEQAPVEISEALAAKGG